MGKECVKPRIGEDDVEPPARGGIALERRAQIGLQALEWIVHGCLL